MAPERPTVCAVRPGRRRGWGGAGAGAERGRAFRPDGRDGFSAGASDGQDRRGHRDHAGRGRPSRDCGTPTPSTRAASPASRPPTAAGATGSDACPPFPPPCSRPSPSCTPWPSSTRRTGPATPTVVGVSPSRARSQRRARPHHVERARRGADGRQRGRLDHCTGRAVIAARAGVRVGGGLRRRRSRRRPLPRTPGGRRGLRHPRRPVLPTRPGGLVRADGRFLPVHHLEPVADDEGRILGSSGGTPPFVTSGGGVAHVDGDGRDVCRVEPSADRKTVRTRTPRAPRCGSAPRPSGPSPRRADTLRGRAGLRRRHRAANSGSPPSGGARRQRLRARTARGALRRRPPATPPAAPHSDSAPPGPGRRTARAAMSSSRRPRL